MICVQNRQADMETDKPIAIGEIFSLRRNLWYNNISWLEDDLFCDLINELQVI